MNTNHKRKQDPEKINAKELVGVIFEFFKNPENKKKKYPVFTFEEGRFILQTLYNKPYKYLPIAFAEFIASRSEYPFTKPRNVRRLKFVYEFISCGSATEAARRAGYSPKCAKQQAYRTLKWIHQHMDEPIG